MPIEQSDEGIKPFQVRPGVGEMPNWGGMFRRGDPSRIPPNRFHALLNVRWEHSELQSRPGLAKSADSGPQMDACITGLADLDDAEGAGTAVHLDLVQLDSTSPSRYGLYGAGTVTAFNEDQDPPAHAYWQTDALTRNTVPAKRSAQSLVPTSRAIYAFRGKQYAMCDQPISGGSDTIGYLFEVTYSFDGGVPRVDLAFALDPDEATNGHVIDGCVRSERADDSQTGTRIVGDALYLTTDQGKILRWDGTTLSVEHTMASATPTHVITHKGQILFAAADGAGGYAYQLAAGGAWVDGTWPVPTAGGTIQISGLADWLNRVTIVSWSKNGEPDASHHGDLFYWDAGTPAVATQFFDGAAVAPDPVRLLGQAIVVSGELYVVGRQVSGTAGLVLRATSYADPNPTWYSPETQFDPYVAMALDNRLVFWSRWDGEESVYLYEGLRALIPGEIALVEEILRWDLPSDVHSYFSPKGNFTPLRHPEIWTI